jgi:glycosyltransferase involved in cell wall biosynthesis
MLSIVIPYRNEEMLAFTVSRLQATVTVPYEIITVDDGSDKEIEVPDSTRHLRLHQPMGVDIARNIGIRAARYDTVLVIDAHMNFWDDDWAARLVEYNLNFPTHIACTVSVRLTPEQMEMSEAEGHQWGAYLTPTKVTYDPGLHPAMRRSIFVPHWNESETLGEIGCILGGAYLLSRRWYIDVLHAPWQYLRGWGSSEPLISVVNYMMDGQNVCLDLEIGHMYRSGRYDLVPYISQMHNILYNQLFMAFVFVADEVERKRLIAHLELHRHPASQQAWQQLERSDYESYRDYLAANGSRNWTDYKLEWIDSV